MSESPIKHGTFVGRIFSALGTLVSGMRVTLHYLVRPKTVVTQQYPENKNELKMFDRFRAQLTMIHDENGFHKCTSCKFCEQVCPNGSIRVIQREKPVLAKIELEALLWRLDSCTVCNACVMVCPFGVLKFGPNFEGAVYDRRLLVYNMSKYAGAPSNQLMKIEDPAERLNAIEPRTPYCGPVPMCGQKMDGVAAVGETKVETEESTDAKE